jgi:thioredoxin-related protein
MDRLCKLIAGGDDMKKKVPVVIAAMIMVAFAVKAYATGWETYMLLYFSGSDWCHWCQKIDAEFFSSDVFKQFAKKNLICVSVDFPRNKKLGKELKEQNDALAKKYDVHGYPKVILLSPEGESVGQTGYSKIEAKQFVENLKKMIDEHRQNESQQKAEKPLPSGKTDAVSDK